MGKDMQEIERTLWAAADKMIGGLSVTNYKFVVLGLIFLKYIPLYLSGISISLS